MSLKRTKGKDGREYYFEEGRRVSEQYYKLHWYEGGKGRMSKADFDEFYSDLPPNIDFDTARSLQNAYFEETRGDIEEQRLQEREDRGEVLSEYIPHFALTPYTEEGQKFYVKTEGTPGFIQVSATEAQDLINEKAREANQVQRARKVYTFTKIYTKPIIEAGDFIGESFYIDFTDQQEINSTNE